VPAEISPVAAEVTRLKFQKPASAMRQGTGIVCIVIGVLLLVKGHDVAHSIASQVKELLTGAPVSQALKLYLAGTGLGLFGLLLIFWKGK
jgi:hypothetical protein